MKKLASLCIFVVLSLINNSATMSLNVPHCLLNDSSFLRFFSFIGKSAQLHVLASTACFEESTSVINRIVSYAFMPPRAFFTQQSAIGGNPYTCDGIGWLKGRFSEELCLRNAILLLCGRALWTTHFRIPPKYITYLVVYAGTDSDAQHLANDTVLMEYSEDVNFLEAVCSKNRLVVPRNQEIVGLSNSSDVFSVKEVQMSETIGGAVLPMHCVYYTTCLHPGLNVFVDLLHSKNATVAIHPDDFFSLSYKQMKAFLRSLVPGSIVYNPSHEIRQNTAFRELNPHLTVVRYLENCEFKFFVKKPSRFPKSAVLVLPLERSVWIMLAVTYVILLVLLDAQISPGVTKSSIKRSGIAFSLISSMLQQSALVTFRGRNLSVRRATFGLWLILALVLSSGFKGCLTRLLKNIPASETLPPFNVDHGAYIGYSAHAVECTRNSRGVPSYSILTFPAGDNSGICFVHQLKRKAAAKIFIMANSFPQELLDIVLQQLDKLGYTWIEGNLGTGLVGPVVPYASPYKRALADVLQKGVEAGLFQKARHLDHFKAVYKRIRMLHRSLSPDEGTLILGDLEVYFATVIVGMAVSLVALFLEIITYYCHCFFTVA